jgi:hypothetical protein
VAQGDRVGLSSSRDSLAFPAAGALAATTVEGDCGDVVRTVTLAGVDVLTAFDAHEQQTALDTLARAWRIPAGHPAE